MKIAVTSSGDTLNDPVDSRFGRCSRFVIVDSNSMSCDVIRNDLDLAGSGAGIQAAQRVCDRGAEVVITGNCGPKAFRVLAAAGIKVVSGASGNVGDVVREYLDGKLKPSNGPSAESHAGERV